MDFSWKFKAARRFLFLYEVHDTWSFGNFCDEKFAEEVLTKAKTGKKLATHLRPIKIL
jgi:hypothetical protein